MNTDIRVSLFYMPHAMPVLNISGQLKDVNMHEKNLFNLKLYNNR